MSFLIKTAFWLTLVLVLIPFASDRETRTDANIDPIAAYFAAQAAVSDLSGFCDRNPAACETGGEALNAIGARARDGARIVYEYLDTQVATPENAEPIVTGSTGDGVVAGQPPLPAIPQSWQPDLTKVSSKETPLGPLPRPKPRSGQKS